MLEKVRNYIRISIAISVVFILLGIVCIIKPDITFDVLSIILTILFLLNGILILVVDFRYGALFMNDYLYGILSIIIGFVFIIHPSALKTIVPLTVGIWFVVSALLNLKLSYYLRRASTSSTVLTIILSIVSIICGLLLIVYPGDSLEVLVITFGITLIVHSLSSIVDMLIIRKHINKIVKNIKFYLSEFSE